LLFSSALFFYQSWIHRVTNLDRSLRETAGHLAYSVRRNAAGTLQIPGSVVGTLQILEIPSLRYAVSDAATGAIAVGSAPGLIKDVAKLPVSAASAGSFDFRDENGASERGYVTTAGSNYRRRCPMWWSILPRWVVRRWSA
jgi:hypothetical protein